MYFLGIFHIVAADPKAIVAARVPSPKAGGSELIFADKSQPPPPAPSSQGNIQSAPSCSSSWGLPASYSSEQWEGSPQCRRCWVDRLLLLDHLGVDVPVGVGEEEDHLLNAAHMHPCLELARLTLLDPPLVYPFWYQECGRCCPRSQFTKQFHKNLLLKKLNEACSFVKVKELFIY